MEDLVTIGTFSMLSGLSVVALRHYDEIGLLKPIHVDPQSGYRRYARTQLPRAWAIVELRRIDLPLDDIREALDEGDDARRQVLAHHRRTLLDRGRDVEAMLADTDRLLTPDDENGARMPLSTAEDARLVAVNIGVRSEDELAAAAAFWEAVLETTLEDWNGQGRSRQARLGHEDHAFFFNLRVRDEDEPHFGHRAAFGLAVTDLDGALARAKAAGGVEGYPPTQTEDQPRHALIHDPVGNRAVLWQQ